MAVFYIFNGYLYIIKGTEVSVIRQQIHMANSE